MEAPTEEDPLADLSPEDRAAAIAYAREQCWRDGDLRWKLDANQRGMYDAWDDSEGGRFVFECGRRVGKTFLLAVIAIETCIRESRVRVPYGAQTLKTVSEFIIPTIEAICEDAPPDVKPRFNSASGHFEFPNGSFIALFGCDDKAKADRGRGPGARRAIVDEAGFIPILKYVVKSVLRPQLLTTGGDMLIGSSPAEEPGHEFTEICEQAEANGNLVHRTLFDNPRLSQERIREYIEEDAKDEGMSVEEYMATDTFRREYKAERAVDKSLVVMGDDWTKVREAAFVEVERPEYFDGYESLDIGGVDPHALLFGYWHFEKSWLVIEDELLLRNGENTAQIAEEAKAKEKALWGTDGHEGTLRGLYEEKEDPRLLPHLPDWLRDAAQKMAPRQPYLRVCDNDIQIAKDLHQLHRISFLPTEKTDLYFHINSFRVLARQGRVKVHPRCVHLERQLRTVMWANPRMTDIARKNGEHGDLLMAAVYMCRNVRQNRNPHPPPMVNQDNQWVRQPKKPSSPLRALLTPRR